MRWSLAFSGNSKAKEHLAAGAKDFFQKQIPADQIIVSSLIANLLPPSDWKVLVSMTLR